MRSYIYDVSEKQDNKTNSKIQALPDGDMHLKANKVRITSNEKDPLSTKSPLNRYGFSSEGSPLSSKIFKRSQNCRNQGGKNQSAKLRIIGGKYDNTKAKQHDAIG